MNRQINEWISRQGWKQFRFQQETAAAIALGHSGLLHAPTGMGKTLAVFLPLLDRFLKLSQDSGSENDPKAPISLLWLTPLRALSNDTLKALRKPVVELGIPWSLEIRNGDTPAAARARQKERLPTVLITTPESLSLLLSYPDTLSKLTTLRAVVVDEWHELLGSKRGVQTELALARIRRSIPSLQTWGLSATLGNLQEALSALTGINSTPRTPPVIVSGGRRKRIEIKTILPPDIETFPWAGHLGLRLLPQVIAAVKQARTTLIFTNTRSQTELWYRAIVEARADLAGDVGLHHGSLDRADREEVERRLRTGEIRAVVCTSSLDLGVDFSPVEQVIQIGGPKGIARLQQRAGRSGHQPGAVSRILCVPTQALELVEYSAVRQAIDLSEVEPRTPLTAPLDVLVQHMVTCALGGGFTRDDLFAELRTTHAYRHLSSEEFDWALQFVQIGGRSLHAYPEYHRVVEVDGKYIVATSEIARNHRMQMGTISGDSALAVKFVSGRTLGSVEEHFIARLKPGARFSFAGRALELVRVREATAFVKVAKKSARLTAIWGGSRLSLSNELANAVRRKLDEVVEGRYVGREMRAVQPLLETQGRLSCIPRRTELLIETTVTREGRHWFLFPFAGRLGHEGLGSLLAHRIGRKWPSSITITVNDYGLELLASQDFHFDEAAWRDLLSPENLVEDLLGCLNTSELARRQFREVARVAGLVFQGYPGARKTLRQVQASSSLFYEVFTQYEPEHLLLNQAKREVLERQLEVSRLQLVLDWARSASFRIEHPSRLTPFAFPLWAEMIRGFVSTETWTDRVTRMAQELENASSLPDPSSLRGRIKEKGRLKE